MDTQNRKNAASLAAPLQRFYVLFALCLHLVVYVQAQPQLVINPVLNTKQWEASWIAHPAAAPDTYGVYHFRRSFNLPSTPDSFIVHVTADNRYRLFVNGKAVGSGPARGDKMHWSYDTYNLAPYLKVGDNVLAAQVWHMGRYRPMAQMTMGPASLLVQGNSEREAIANTNSKNWKVIQNTGFRPYPVTSQMVLNQYYATGACDSLLATHYPWSWETAAYNDQAWLRPQQIRGAIPAHFAAGYGEAEGSLVPRSIPMIEEKLQRIPKLIRSEGIKADDGFLKGKRPLVIPPHARATILLDQSHLTTAYPELWVSGGKGSSIDIAYAESLYDGNMKKGNRNETAGKRLYGYHDAFQPDGGHNRSFRPLWYRTYRYIELTITTQAAPLSLNDFYGMFTAYPFTENAAFASNDPLHQKIWEVGWRTARLCANETYYDTPYYEQLQYIGDTRIQALISLHVAGDDRLMRNALVQFHYSRLPEGLTQSRYPTDQVQIITPFSLYWVDMVHDYHTFRKDDAFVQQFLPGIQTVLSWFENRLNQNKMLSNLSWWNFVDWAPQFDRGVPKGAEDAQGTSIITLQYVYALDRAAELFQYHKAQAQHYKALAGTIRAAVYQQCFDLQKQLLADTPAKQQFSQHANVMAILTDAVPAAQQAALMQQLLSDKSLTQCTIYYKFYLMRALKKTGMGNLYTDNLGTWKAMLAQGLTTFPEEDSPGTRSDCHAWSASPLIDFLAIVCGIEPASPGFATVRIAPHPGPLKEIKGKMPHPLGIIEVTLKRKGSSGIAVEVILPEGLTGEFIWNNEKVNLLSGRQTINR
ncbi:alpha-L-rhamnosidase C-terminal domain-containing protein [Pontibacter sp. SGAir0037]|uniref:alpha-L-rhamnosidase-related protein n=1 Tax=Pontibacter sp. SGAir0037 TaxID=2571030 RepID=UPI0010CD220E|nr:alpha-L-rhamnosidase C-terminal domain-containing protein [Pontibacter sp. SGAir0037]QCR24693.1 alpha-L-rhamnosidase [Pontibacter sp. SGAir0037]